MTTIEMIDQIAAVVPSGSPMWCRVMDLRARVASERAALREAVDRIAVMRDLSEHDPDFIPSTIPDVMQQVMAFLADLENDNERAMDALDLHAQLQEAVEEIASARRDASQMGQAAAGGFRQALDIIAEKTGVRHGE